MKEKIIIAGFGGQGVLLIGRLLAHAGMLENKEVSFFPSYGMEMRGGTATCTVIISDKKIGSPIVPHPDTAIVMNRLSMDKFEPVIRKGGLMIVNKSMVDRKAERNDIEVIEIPADEMAREIGNKRVANMIVLGAYLAKRKILPREIVVKSLQEVLSERHRDLVSLDERAIREGVDFAGGNRC